MSKLDGETRCICKGQVIEEGSSLEGKNPYDPKLLAYPMEGRLSGQMILYWYFHADGKRTLRICEFLPFDPEWWGSGFAREDAFLLWRLETAANDNAYTTFLPYMTSRAMRKKAWKSPMRQTLFPI